MIRKIVKYRVFANTMVFEEWQREEQRNITQIIPLAGSTVERDKETVYYNYDIMVCYVEDEEIE